MSFRHRTQAIVLKNSIFREKDRIISFYTKELGKIEVLGKSIRKEQAKLRSFVQFPYFLEIDYIQGKNHKILTDVILKNNFSNIRKNFKKIAIAYKVSYTIDFLIKESEKDEKIWDLLLSVFLFLDKEEFSENKSLFVYSYFLWNLLFFLGYKINLSEKSCFFNIFELFEKQELDLINNLDEKWQIPLNKFICQKIKK